LSLKQFTDYQRNEQLFSVFPELNHNAQRVIVIKHQVLFLTTDDSLLWREDRRMHQSIGLGENNERNFWQW